MNLAAIAKRLGGELVAGGVNAPGPNHSARDRSFRVWFDAQGELAFTSYSPRDSWADCRDYLRRQGVIEDDHDERRAPAPRPAALRTLSADEDAARRQKAAVQIFAEASDPRGTIVETYLHARGGALPPAGAEAIRFAPSLKHGPSGGLWPAMVALVTDAVTGKPVAAHRTFLRHDGEGKAPVELDKMTLGPCKGGVVRLVDDEEIEQRLAVGEGIETCLSMIAAGWATWSTLNAPGLRTFPFLPGLDLSIAADADENGAGQAAAEALARRWADAGGWAEILEPDTIGFDWNDVAREAAS